MRDEIRNIKNSILRKLKSAAGVSIAELLVATIILLLASSGLVAVANLANHQFMRSVRQSEAESLYTNLETLIYYEFQHVDTTDPNALYCDESGKVLMFHSVSFSSESGGAAGTLVSLDDNDQVAEYGQLAFCIGGAYNRILGQSAYQNDLAAKADISYNSSAGIFTVTLTIAMDNTIIKQASFDVIPYK